MKSQSLLITLLLSATLTIASLGGCSSPNATQTTDVNSSSIDTELTTDHAESAEHSFDEAANPPTTNVTTTETISNETDKSSGQTQEQPVCAQVVRFANDEITIEYGQLSDPVSGGVGFGFKPNGVDKQLALSEICLTNSETLKVGDVVMVTHRIDKKTGTNYDFEVIAL